MVCGDCVLSILCVCDSEAVWSCRVGIKQRRNLGRGSRRSELPNLVEEVKKKREVMANLAGTIEGTPSMMDVDEDAPLW